MGKQKDREAGVFRVYHTVMVRQPHTDTTPLPYRHHLRRNLALVLCVCQRILGLYVLPAAHRAPSNCRLTHADTDFVVGIGYQKFELL